MTFFEPAEIEALSGLSLHTIRAWERRYGVLAPQRTPGGHRLYSQQDVETLRWLKHQVDAGVSIGKAVATLRAQRQPGPTLHPETLAANLLAALERLDERAAEHQLSQALTVHSVETLCLDILQPVLVQIGERWAAGTLPVAVEHFSSTVLRGYLHGLLRFAPLSEAGSLVVVACIPGERHEIGPMMVSLFLRRAGLRALFFGADLPWDDLATCLHALKPDALVFSATGTSPLDGVRDHWHRLAASAALPPVVIGGRGAHPPADPAAWPAIHWLGHDIVSAVGEIQRLATVHRRTLKR